MPVIIDANVLSLVFSGDDDFAPIKKWVLQDGAKIVVGGTKYEMELSRVRDVLNVITELSRSGRVVRVNYNDVDSLQKIIESIVPDACDDPHLIALIGVSRCPVICSKDARAYPFLKDKKLYPWKSFSPSIYSGKKNVSLLTRENADAKCFTRAGDNPDFQKFVNRVKRK